MTSPARESPLPLAAGASRRPATPARFLLFLLAVSGLATVFAIAFPPGAPDRLPILAIALALALAAARRPEAGVCSFAFLLPICGLVSRVFGGSDAAAWPVLLFAGLAAGWTFRFLYDFESRPDASRLDAPLRAVALLWALATLLSLLHARTIWALLHGLSGRLVNRDGLPEGRAVFESLMTFAILGAGAAFFFLLRRSGEAVRRRAAIAAAAGTALSGLVAVLEAAEALPWRTRAFWKFTGRVSGGALDPNSLGMLAALAIAPMGMLAVRSRGAARAAWGAGLLLAGAGVVLSGSRSALLVLIVAALVATARLVPGRFRVAALGSAAAALLLALAVIAGVGKGSLGARLAATFDSSRTNEERLSSRPLLWKSAIREFREHPIEGGGLGSFAWRLPDLAEVNGPFRMRDNPGSAYLQALAETGLTGLVLTLWFLGAAGLEAARAAIREELPRAAAGTSILGFLAALVFGSHWLGADVGLMFFLLLALGAGPRVREEGRLARRARGGLLALWALAAAAAVWETASPASAFRFGRWIGFHDAEKTDGGSFRWTRERFAIQLGPGEHRRLGMAHFPPDGRLVEIEASSGDRILYRRALRPGEGVMVSLSAPAGRSAEIVFRLSRSFVPRRLGLSQDRRRLGVMVTGL